MTHALDAGALVSALSSLLYIVLGAWVMTLTPRRRSTIMLGAFAIFFGLEFGLADLAFFFHWGEALQLGDANRHLVWDLASLTHALASVAIFGLAASIPSPLEDRGPAGWALGAGFVFSIATWIPWMMASPSGVWMGSTVSGWRFVLDIVLFFIGSTLTWGAVLLLAFRAAPSRRPSRSEVRQLAMLAIGFAIVWEFIAGAFLTEAARMLVLGEHAYVLWFGAIVLFWLTAAALWGWNMARSGPETVGIHRTVILVVLGTMVAGALLEVMVPAQGRGFGSPGANGLFAGLVRTLGVGLLAYGVLRHDIAGLDAKVEWGVSKTTVAGAFVAVFFVAGEVAETFFGDVLGDYVGIIAAGLLVFAISPLQRLADSIAAKAVPGGAEAGHGVEDQYRAAVDMALADGEISREEERRLAEKADELGIDTTRAFELREKVEDAAGGGGEP